MRKEYPLSLVMIQPDAMPGSYLGGGKTLNQILETVLAEAQMIADMGFDGFILQNMHDGPIGQTARPETIAFMTRLGVELRRHFPELVLGVLVNWDGLASLAVAEAVEADFVRVEHLYTGVSVGNTGFMFGQCEAICNMRKRLGSGIPVFADVQEVNSTYLAPKPKAQAAVDVVRGAFADGVFVSGSNTAESLQYVKEIKALLPGVPVFLGGGATGENIRELMTYYDGVSVATWIKNGNMRNPIDKDRAQLFLSEILAAKAAREKGEGH
ncbi:BtpA/SgcQ family protein [Enterocloster lavalensis]|uniref:BtpA/SgcQ family protein n=1 Tax=Enterocloster lavalensis TaxID=460384 RepID=UPI002A7ECA24|nr:BtpA/SgcQ family protein [Enterocloster lavalensis]